MNPDEEADGELLRRCLNVRLFSDAACETGNLIKLAAGLSTGLAQEMQKGSRQSTVVSRQSSVVSRQSSVVSRQWRVNGTKGCFSNFAALVLDVIDLRPSALWCVGLNFEKLYR